MACTRAQSDVDAQSTSNAEIFLACGPSKSPSYDGTKVRRSERQSIQPMTYKTQDGRRRVASRRSNAHGACPVASQDDRDLPQRATHGKRSAPQGGKRSAPQGGKRSAPPAKRSAPQSAQQSAIQSAIQSDDHGESDDDEVDLTTDDPPTNEVSQTKVIQSCTRLLS